MQFNYQNYSNKSGIYIITNTYTNRVYIGQASVFRERWNRHAQQLRTNTHGNKFFQNDFNKCKEILGHTDFMFFDILKLMENSTRDERDIIEIEEIDKRFDNQNKCYNIKKFPNGNENCGKSSNPEETKEKIGIAAKEMWSDPDFRKSREKEHLKLILVDPEDNEHMINCLLSDFATKNNISYHSLYQMIQGKSKSAFGWRLLKNKDWKYDRNDMPEETRKKIGSHFKGTTHITSEETKQKIREKAINRQCKETKLIAPDGIIYLVTNMKEFCLKYSLIRSAMSRLLNGKIKTHKGWKLYI